MMLRDAPSDLTKGHLRVRPVGGASDMAALLALRGVCFRGDENAPDGDQFDDTCTHMLIEHLDGTLMGGFRLAVFTGRDVLRSYSAQFYDLEPVAQFPTPMLELGRFCIAPDCHDADVLRLAWGAITRQVDGAGIGLLFGCSSFAGCDPGLYRDAFGLLRDRYGPPDIWAPRVKAADTVPFAGLSGLVDRAAGLRALPPLLRTYLTMGGWVSDHAVIDRALGTQHVFTGLEIARVPAARARALRAVAG